MAIGRTNAIGKSKLQEKDVTITQNGTSQVTPDSGYDGMSKATIITNVPSTPTEEKTVALDMASGNQVITPTSGKVLSKVTITKPSTMLATNIKKDVNIGGVVGTYEGVILPTYNGLLRFASAPTISLSNSTLTITAVANATSYAIYSNNTLLTTITTTSVDLSTLITTGGTYTIYAIAKAANYQDSPHSNEVSYTVEQAMPVKGDLINLDMTGSGTTSQYRVLKVNGTIAEVLGMTDLTTMNYHIPISSQTGSFDGGTTGLLYNSSDLDTYLNTTWYNTLSSTAKSALVVKNIIQKMYNFTKNVDSTATYTGIMSDNTHYMLVYKDQKNVGNRNIYTLGVEDVVDYTGNGVDNLNATNIWQMFWDSNISQAGKFIWLNSAYSADSANAFFVFGAYGFLRNNILDSASVRPAFTIDLSKITWLKV